MLHAYCVGEQECSHKIYQHLCVLVFCDKIGGGGESSTQECQAGSAENWADREEANSTREQQPFTNNVPAELYPYNARATRQDCAQVNSYSAYHASCQRRHMQGRCRLLAEVSHSAVCRGGAYSRDGGRRGEEGQGRVEGLLTTVKRSLHVSYFVVHFQIYIFQLKHSE